MPTPNHAGRESAAFPLPQPLPEFTPSATDVSESEARSYFDPQGWNRLFLPPHATNPADPVETGRGKQESEANAALFVSDFHLGDGSAAGDDFLDSHLRADDELGFQTGFTPAGESRAGLFASVLAFALERVAQHAVGPPSLDLVLNGDVVNFLELQGRGATPASVKHKALFRTLAAARGRASVYWLRGNHDYVVPEGPWRTGEFYTNPTLRTLAEHGDFWDKESWPPGPSNKGSRIVIEASAAFEVHGDVLKDGAVKYLMSGVDNLRPMDRATIERFLDRRKKYSEIDWFASWLARFRFGGTADDSDAFQGALSRRKHSYPDWLMVQGHTHVPAWVPSVYANTGSWIVTLVESKRDETPLEIFPFLLVYLDPAGNRQEEYYTVRPSDPPGVATAVRETAESMTALRRSYGCGELKP